MVIWTKPAKVDLRSIHDFIAYDSRYYAKKVVQNIREKTDLLNKLPRMGRMITEINNENVKELSLHSYRIIYEIKGENVFILAVVHKRRDLSTEDIGK